MAKNSLSSSSSIASSTAVKKASGNKKPDNEKNEVTDTTKALRDSILKPLVKTHGLEKVLEKIPYHISERKMLNITGFKVRFNDLGVNTNQSSGTKKRLQIERIMKEFRAKSGDAVDLVPERKS
jgi:hypothetical protein